MSTHSSRTLGFASRLTLMMASVVLVAVVVVASLLYVSYRNSFTRATLDELETSGSLNVQFVFAVGTVPSGRDDVSGLAGCRPFQPA